MNRFGKASIRDIDGSHRAVIHVQRDYLGVVKDIDTQLLRRQIIRVDKSLAAAKEKRVRATQFNVPVNEG